METPQLKNIVGIDFRPLQMFDHNAYYEMAGKAGGKSGRRILVSCWAEEVSTDIIITEEATTIRMKEKPSVFLEQFQIIMTLGPVVRSPGFA